jgi:hypothetical protein
MGLPVLTELRTSNFKAVHRACRVDTIDIEEERLHTRASELAGVLRMAVSE